MPYLSVNEEGIITAVSDHRFNKTGEVIHLNHYQGNTRDLLNKKIVRKGGKLKLAVICNWDQDCGISTYSRYLVDSLRPMCSDVRIFSEEGCEPSDSVVPCWKRGQSMSRCLEALKGYGPDFVLVQHEFGIFPKATFLLQLLHGLQSYSYAVTLHSTYEHLDKSVCTSAMKNIIVHTNNAKSILRKIGNSSNIHVIPHGCIDVPSDGELWNIFQTPYAMVQFGFGFFYKGVDRAIEAVKLLKDKDPEKYREIFYCYLCSQTKFTKNIQTEYLKFLEKKIEDLGLVDNVAIISKYHTDQEISHYLRTAKLALFPYLINPDNIVYGASGAIRIAMANGIPVIASESHLFDELPVPRPNSVEGLADEIDKIFSDHVYRKKLVGDALAYVKSNSWNHCASDYLRVFQEIRKETIVSLDSLNHD